MEENISEFSIYRKGNLIMIKNNKNINVSNLILNINVLDYSSAIKSTNDLGEKLKDCLGIIGTVTLEEDTYLIIITDSKIECTIDKKKIYKVLDTCFVNFSEDKKENSDNNKINDHLQNNDIELINELKELFKSSFYYSNSYDLANSITSHNQIMFYFQKGKLITDYDHIVKCNKNFLSNWQFIEKIMSLQTKSNIKYFFSNCIYGNIEHFKIDNYMKGYKIYQFDDFFDDTKQNFDYFLFGYKLKDSSYIYQIDFFSKIRRNNLIRNKQSITIDKKNKKNLKSKYYLDKLENNPKNESISTGEDSDKKDVKEKIQNPEQIENIKDEDHNIYNNYKGFMSKVLNSCSFIFKRKNKEKFYFNILNEDEQEEQEEQ